MNIALFVPCLVDHFFPEVARDTLELLEKLGHAVVFPAGQTCCGQMMTNSGCVDQAKATVIALADALSSEPCDVVVAPAASCLVAAKENLARLAPEHSGALPQKMFELVEFLHDVAPIEQPLRPLRRTVSMQLSCHGLRMLGLATPSELAVAHPHNKFAALLGQIPELIVTRPERDECCGFGGTFSVDERDISGKMACDKVAAHAATGADAIVGYDPSCLMSLGGVVSRQQRQLEVMHCSALLNSAL